jgi:hypothetical protein
VVWLTDLQLGPACRAASTSEELAGALRDAYADRVPVPLLQRLDAGDASAFDPAAEGRFGLLLTAEVVREARGVIVESPAAARRLRLDLGTSAPQPRMAIVDPRNPGAAADALLALLSELATT